ncbi:MAG: D-alanine--D-alanine ligase [Gammaproteobacteria bacterium]|jgi:D-alanine-D-alanine ligase|nr:D-alanine--D-alanine ligase [Gammaproteobacteria bacterium]MBT6043468.1 D-alanine--D-alanine ligase [Gammaproteobacteria bacterium]
MTEANAYKPEEFGRVAVLMGGDSAEREISLLSGSAVLDSLLRSKVDATAIDFKSKDVFADLLGSDFDRVLIMLHGRKGEDGKVQGALELMNIPYTGSGVLASALAMDKVRCKRLWQNLGLNTPAFTSLNSSSEWSSIINDLGPVFVKPVKEGSSIGISKASNASELEKAFALALKYDNAVIAETFIDGPEYTVAILGDSVLPVVGMKAKNDFYDYDAKYFSDATSYFCPCDLSADEEKVLGELARNAYEAVGCYGWGRVDVMRDNEGDFWLLEVNTVPGMTDHSLVPMAAKQAGIGFDELVLEILASSHIDRERD